MNRTLYADRMNRDNAYREAKAQGLTVRRGTTRNQRLRPMYVEDVPNGETSFGNSGRLSGHTDSTRVQGGQRDGHALTLRPDQPGERNVYIVELNHGRLAAPNAHLAVNRRPANPVLPTVDQKHAELR